MNEKAAALAAVESVRRSTGYAGLDHAERAELDHHLDRLRAAFGGDSSDPFAVPFATPTDFGRPPGPGGVAVAQPPGMAVPAGPPPAQKPTGLDQFGQRTREAIEAVDFPTFVAGLVRGTFQAVVDATVQQIREYARLVQSLATTVDRFTDENVTENQARAWLAERHPQHLEVVLPRAGENRPPRLVPRRGSEGQSPDWLGRYGLAGQELTAEMTEGALLSSARRSVGEERMSHLATLVLMGLNRIVVQDGTIRARLQFHAKTRETVGAEVALRAGGGQMGFAGQETAMQAASVTQVSTIQANAQTEDAFKAELLGEVTLKFRTEVFELNRFADTEAIQLLNRHAKRDSKPATMPAAEATRPQEGQARQQPSQGEPK